MRRPSALVPRTAIGTIVAALFFTTPACAIDPELRLHVRADLAGPEAPRLVIYLNGDAVGETLVTNTDWTTLSVRLPRDLRPGDRLDLYYPNDYADASGDRNLFVDHISCLDLDVSVNPSSFRYDRGADYASVTDGQDALAGQSSMFWSGALRMTVPGATPPPRPSVVAQDSGYTGRFPDGTSSRIFSDDAFWYRRLSATAPLDPNSDAIVRHLTAASVSAFNRSPWRHPATVPANAPSVGISTDSFSPGVFLTNDGDPVAAFTWDNCNRWPWNVGDQGLIDGHLTGIHVPARATAAAGTDREMVVYNSQRRQLTELWQVTKKDATHFAVCWGGTIADAKASNGVFPAPYGATATGLPFTGGLIMPSELEAGRIDHVVGVSIAADVLNSSVSSPATRGDGTASGWDTIASGQLLRLPAELDVDALRLSPISTTIAKAAQNYGLIVWDRGGSMTFRALNPDSIGLDPYPGLFQADGYVMMGNTDKGENPFPIDKLQVVQRDYVKP